MWLRRFVEIAVALLVLRMITPGSRSVNKLELLLLLTVWFAYGLTINSGNLIAFGLQQAGVEAYVERHSFYLEGSQLESFKVNPVVDAFLYNGHIYPAKQPGQFMIGALAYSPLHFLGLNYSNHYLLTSALVTFLTASLITALSVLAVFKIVSLLKPQSVGWSIACALVYGFATTAFPYSGIAWHDSIATGYLVWAFYLLLRIRGREEDRVTRVYSALAGLMLGLTVVTSMLPFPITIGLSLYFFSLRRLRLVWFFLGGGLLGLAPLLIYNQVCFGNPFLLPNVAGGYRDTFLHFSRENFLAKLRFYSYMLTIYVPVFWAGLLGLIMFPRRFRHEQLLIGVILLASVVYILNIEATGTCQYGPRYLLPAMPFASIGLVGFSFVRNVAVRVALTSVLAVVAAASFLINCIGALHGAMLCDFPEFAAGIYVSQMVAGGMRSYPLARWLALPFFAVLILWLKQVVSVREIGLKLPTERE